METFFTKLLVELDIVELQTPNYQDHKPENGFDGFGVDGVCRGSVVARNEERTCCGAYSKNNRRMSILSKC